MCYIQSAMKHILDNPYHLWANEAYANSSEDWAANPSRNRSFRGKSAYSYSTEVARIVRNSEGQVAYLLTSCRYSKTTNRHMSEIEGSVPSVHINRVFKVPSLNGNHDYNIRRYSDRVTECLGKAKRARLYKYFHYQSAVDLHTEWARYCEFFGLPFTPNPEVLLIEPRLEEIREADGARRTKAYEACRKKQEAECAKRLEQLAPILEAWKSGGPRDYRFNYLPTDCLRVSGNNVETTRGASVPLSQVLAVLPTVLAIVKSGRAWTPARDMRLGHYSLTGISEDGTVTVGCHRFPKDEVIRFAGTIPLGITDSDHWDCDCESGYIRPNSVNSCDRCHARREDCPDSRTAETQTIQ